MQSSEVIFSMTWMVRSTQYIVYYQQGFELELFDELICRVLCVKGRAMNWRWLGKEIGFNLVSDIPAGRFYDQAEEEIFQKLLKPLYKFGLITEQGDMVSVTKAGLDALETGFKYSFHYASTELFEHVGLQVTPMDFSFSAVYGLSAKLVSVKEDKAKNIIFDKGLHDRLQHQLFYHDEKGSRILQVYKSEPKYNMDSLSLNCKVSFGDTGQALGLNYKDSNLTVLTAAFLLPENEHSYHELLQRAKYEHLLACGSMVNSGNLESFRSYWDLGILAAHPRMDWNDVSTWALFREFGNGGIWSMISSLAPLGSIWENIDQYVDFLDWGVLSARFESSRIVESINRLPWDFEELSELDANVIISILDRPLSFQPNWNWSKLSLSLDEEFIVGHINDYPWDYQLMTEKRFDIFKRVFSETEQIALQLNNNWNWLYIYEEINIRFLYQRIYDFGSRIDWVVVLDRLMNDPILSVQCIVDERFMDYLRVALPIGFSIGHQQYLWTGEMIAFFDRLGRVNWNSTPFLKGLDTSPHIPWEAELLRSFGQKVHSPLGRSHISSSIVDLSMVLGFPSFSWDYKKISSNLTTYSNREFIVRMVANEPELVSKMDWGMINSDQGSEFWRPLLPNIATYSKFEDNIRFWVKITENEEFSYISSNPELPWDWSTVSQNATVEEIMACIGEEMFFEKWNWRILSKRLGSGNILAHLEEGMCYWDWQYLVERVFSLNELDLNQGYLTRIAVCLQVLDSGDRKLVWSTLTNRLPISQLFEFIAKTASVDFFEWDWDKISQNRSLPADLQTLHRIKNRLNWTIFSSSSVVTKKFNWASYDGSSKAQLEAINTYLKNFLGFWDWGVLSRNGDLHSSRSVLKNFAKLQWDWAFLSESGRFLLKQKNDQVNYLGKLLDRFPIHYRKLSGRRDIELSGELILERNKEDWDWSLLSANPSAGISFELVGKLPEKTWNWKILSSRENIGMSNVLLIGMLDRPWDWKALSASTELIFDAELISCCITKPMNWRAISMQDSLSLDLNTLSSISHFDLDWGHISASNNLRVSRGLLEVLGKKLNWNYLSKNPNIDFTDIGLIEGFSDYWDWKYICERTNFPLTPITLSKFTRFLDWKKLSANQKINFTRELIDAYADRWSWRLLRYNYSISEELRDYVLDRISKSPKLSFLFELESQSSNWTGYVYHFSHLENAVDIIRKRSIESRHKATIKADAAGSVVHRRADAHDYARFYFRPKTPTQFYNEFLGTQPEDGYRDREGNFVSHYERARSLSFPKCPVPIFFRFSASEVLSNVYERCCISNGNMQTSSTQFGSIDEMIGRFNFMDVFFSPVKYSDRDDYRRYINYAQQEFLVRDNLDFSGLNDYQIICPSEQDRELLLDLLGEVDPVLVKRIVVDPEYYNGFNPKVNVDRWAGVIEITNPASVPGYLTISPFKSSDMESIQSGEFDRHVDDELIFRHQLTIAELEHSFTLDYYDESGRKWMIYQYTPKNSDQLKEVPFQALDMSEWWQDLPIEWRLLVKANLFINRMSTKDQLAALSFQADPVWEILSHFIPDFGTYLFGDIHLTELIELEQLRCFIYDNSFSPLVEGYRHIVDLAPLSRLGALKVLRLERGSEELITMVRKLKLDFLILPQGKSWLVNSTAQSSESVDIFNRDERELSFFLHGFSRSVREGGFAATDFLHRLKQLGYGADLEAKVRHYTIERHTLLVCGVFERYFAPLLSAHNLWLFRCLLPLHDIGKSRAFFNGDKNGQYAFTQKILIELQAQLPLDDADFLLVSVLLSTDVIGTYMTSKTSLSDTVSLITTLAKQVGKEQTDFLGLLIFYYQCDTAAYTADEGGLQFMEHLFEYENDSKIFDSQRKLLKFSGQYGDLYEKLEEALKYGN